MQQEGDLQTFRQGTSIGEGDGLAELPGHARHWGVEAQALLDAHGAVSHPAQVLPVGTGSLSLTLAPLPVLPGPFTHSHPAPEQIPLQQNRGTHHAQPQAAGGWGCQDTSEQPDQPLNKLKCKVTVQSEKYIYDVLW